MWGSADLAGPGVGVVAPWPFTAAALPALRREGKKLWARRLFTHAPLLSRSSRELRGPHPRRGIGNLHSQPPRLWTSPPPLPCDCRFATSLHQAQPPRDGLTGRRGPRSPGVVQRSPLHRMPCGSPPFVESAGRLRADLSRYAAGVAVALSRLPPWVPTSSFGYDLAGFFLPPDAGVLHPAPILGFGPFRPASALASATLPAPQSRPSKSSSPGEATRPAHAHRAAARHTPAVASRRFTEPLTASFFVVADGNLAVLLLPRSGTNRTALPRAGAPLLPWA